MIILLWVIIVLLYLLCGLIFASLMVRVFHLAPKEFNIGLMVLFWFLLVLWDILMQSIRGVGKTASFLISKITK